MNTNQKKQQKQATQDLAIGRPVARPGNDNQSVVVGSDTTALVTHREVVETIKSTLIRFGRRRHLEDDIPEVQTRALEVARRKRMPLDLQGWKGLTRTIAKRLAFREKKNAEARKKYDAGLCEEPDEHGPIEREKERDPVDKKRYLGILKAMFDAGEMPERGAEILWGVAEGLTREQLAEETGLGTRQIAYRLGCMRALWRERLTELGLLVELVDLGPLGRGPASKVANDVTPAQASLRPILEPGG